MIQDRILKIMKGLNTFSQDDIIIMADVDEIEADEILAEFIKEEKIIPIDKNKFKYQPAQKSLTFRLVEKQKIQLVKDNNITFRQAAEYFLTNYAQENLTPSTYKTYRSLINSNLIPFFWKMELKNITQYNLKEFIELKSKQGMTNKRLNSHVTLFGNMFNKFKEWGFVSESPYNGIINVKFEKKCSIQILNVSEVQTFLKTAKTSYPYLYLPALMILSTGIRKAELLALKKEDIDLTNRKININKTLCEKGLLFPKVRTVIRQVNIPENLVLKLYQVIKNKQQDDFVFYDTSLSWFTQDKRIRIEFAMLVKQLKFPRITFNELRHTYAYSALQDGMSVDSLHKQLGDYLLQATMDKYGDFIKN
ncbi:MAG: tyrosine-type recombinase/integrase [bacterium]